MVAIELVARPIEGTDKKQAPDKKATSPRKGAKTGEQAATDTPAAP
jgi:hypothetical protein